MPKYQVFPFLVWCIFGSRSPSRFSVDDGTARMVALTTVPALNRKPREAR